MKLKSSLLIGTISMACGFIPLSTTTSHNINYCLQSSSLSRLNIIKDDVVSFYLHDCQDAKYQEIERKIKRNIDNLPYNAYYKNHTIFVYEEDGMVMEGTLYEVYKEEFIKDNFFFANKKST